MTTVFRRKTLTNDTTTYYNQGVQIPVRIEHRTLIYTIFCDELIREGFATKNHFIKPVLITVTDSNSDSKMMITQHDVCIKLNAVFE